MKNWIDLSQAFFEWDALEKTVMHGPKIRTSVCSDKPYGKFLGEGFRIHIMEFTFQTHSGTHIDAPSHFCENGKMIDQIPFERFVGEGICLAMSKSKFGVISSEDLKRAWAFVRRGDVVLLSTGWGDKYGTDEYFEHPSLGIDAAEWLVKQGVSIIGIDTLTPDIAIPLRDKEFDYPIHKILLKNDILIIENLANLKTIVGHRATIASFPLKIKNADGAPARVFALMES
jgi:arylformamidase